MTEPTGRRQGDAFAKLVRLRKNVTWSLSGVMLVLLVINISLMSVWADVGARPLLSGGIVTIGIAFSIVIIVAGAAISIGYTIWANSVLDSLINQAIDELAADNQEDAHG